MRMEGFLVRQVDGVERRDSLMVFPIERSPESTAISLIRFLLRRRSWKISRLSPHLRTKTHNLIGCGPSLHRPIRVLAVFSPDRDPQRSGRGLQTFPPAKRTASQRICCRTVSITIRV
ncbi:hypothetical protein SRHO_G00327480 [Serrasalmus rhombeus]